MKASVVIGIIGCSRNCDGHGENGWIEVVEIQNMKTDQLMKLKICARFGFGRADMRSTPSILWFTLISVSFISGKNFI